MNSTANFMSALSGYGTTRPITRPPTMIRPYPPGTAPLEDDLAMAMRAENQPGYLPRVHPGLDVPGPAMPVPPNAPGPPRAATKPYDGSIFAAEPASPLPGGMPTPEMPAGAPDFTPDNEGPGLGQKFLMALGQSMARLGRQGSNNGSFRVRRPRTE